MSFDLHPRVSAQLENNCDGGHTGSIQRNDRRFLCTGFSSFSGSEGDNNEPEWTQWDAGGVGACVCEK